MKTQIYLLWSRRIVRLLLADELKALALGYERVDFPNVQPGSTNMFKRALERGAAQRAAAVTTSSRPWRKLGSREVYRTSVVCGMYHAALTTLAQLRLDILSGR